MEECAEEYKEVIKRIQDEKKSEPGKRSAMFQKWTKQLIIAVRGEWTRALICNIDEWINRLYFHLTQMFSGHGYFNKYLHRMQSRASDTPYSTKDPGINLAVNYE